MNTEQTLKMLMDKVSMLEREIFLMKESSTIPLEVDRALSGRGYVKTFPAGIPDPNGDYTTNVGFRRDISLSGGAQTITVPSYPVRWLKLNDGSALYIPLHAYAEFF